MKGKPIKLIILLICLLFVSQYASAQNNFGSEKELRKQAEGLFKDDDYASALPLFSQLLSLYPKDPNFNYKYGVCLLYAKENKEKPLPYLLFALGKEGVDDDVYYHLGRAFHLNYRFDDAIAQYNTFKQKKNKASTKLEVDLQIKQCENGKSLLRNVTDLTVIEKKELSTADYFRAYDLAKISAKLVVKPEELKTPFDSKKKDQSTIILRQTGQDIYYSSYGVDGKNGRDIYRVSRLPDFRFGQPVNLGPNINTPYDEDFPYITPDGKTLYFCSKGHNSMGGYDVFKSELNPSGEWNKPQNLDFAINTPDDDIQYITDPESDFAYFSSKRNSADGNIMVFKVKTERVPVTAAIIKGKVTSEATPVNLAAKISVKNVQTGKFIGTFNSADKDGRYRINLNNGAKYEYTVEQSGTPPMSQFVEIPPMNELRPLKQEIKLIKRDGATSMIIYNYFTDTIENNALETAELFKEKANLDVNYEDQVKSGIISEANNKTFTDTRVLTNRNVYQGGTDENTDVQTGQAGNNNAQPKQGEAGIKNSELVTIAKEDAADIQKEADELRDKSRQAYAFAGLKNNAAQKKYREAAEAESKNTNELSPSDKLAQQELAAKTKKDAENLSQQATMAFNLAKDLETEADAKQVEANQAEQYANELEQAVKLDSKEALEKLEKQSKELEKNQTTAKSNDPDVMLKQANEKNEEAASLEKNKSSLKAEIQESMREEKTVREDILKAKNDAEKEQNEGKLKDILADRKEKQSELTKVEGNIVKLKEEAASLEDEAKTNKEILSQMAEESNLPAVALTPEQKLALATQLSENKTNNAVVAKNETPVADVKNGENTQQKTVPEPKLENYDSYVISTNESKKSNLLEEQQRALASVDSIAKVLNNTTDPKEIEYLTAYQKSFQQVAASKKLAAEMITFNVTNKAYEANSEALSKKLNDLPESEKANFQNTVSMIQNEYSKAVGVREKALQQSEVLGQQTGLSEAVIAQNAVLESQRKLLDQVESSIANKNRTNEATANFKGFNTDRNAPATEAVNQLRPDYSKYSAVEKVASTEVESIKKSADYIQFSEVIEQARKLEETADKKAVEYNTIKKQGEDKVAESQQLIDLAAEEKKKSKRQALSEEAVRVDNEGRDMLNKADTIKIQAQADMLKAAAIKAEADKMLAKLDKAQQDKILAVYQNLILPAAEDNKVVALKDGKTADKSGVVEPKKQTAAKEVVAKQPVKNEVAVKQPEAQQANSTQAPVKQKDQPNNSAKADVVSKKEVKTKDKETVLSEIKATPDYKSYAAIKDEAEKLKTDAASKKAEADSLKIQAQRDAVASNDMFEFAAAQSNKKERKVAQKKAEDMDRESKDKEMLADSMRVVAEKYEANARMKQFEADSYLKKFDELKAKSLLMAYNGTVPQELLTVEEPVQDIAINNTAPSKNTQNSQKSAEASKNIVPEKKADQPVKKEEKLVVANNQKADNQPKKAEKENKITADKNNNIKGTTETKQEIGVSAQPEIVQPKKVVKPDVKTTPEYKQYTSLMNEAEQANAEAAKWKARVDSTKLLSAQKLEESNNKLEEAAPLKKKQRKPLVEEAKNLDYEGQLLARAADSLNVIANEANKNAKDKKTAAESYMSSMDKELALRIMRSLQGIPDPVEEQKTEVVVSPETKVSEKTVAVSNGIAKGKPHNARNPIPMNERLPDGIVFKVQIGAFNRPVVDDAFGTVSPVSGETLANSNLIRYTAGLFTDFNNAVDARKELNAMNYKDAFVVAYCYGKRMSVNEARAMLAAGKDCRTGTPSEIAANNSVKNESANAGGVSNANIVNGNMNAPSTVKPGETLPQQDIQVIKGLLYTVQVGVYSKPVKAGQLYNITPLYYELNKKGLYRYTSGIFDNIREASAAKDVIVKIGVTDAFVSAYINGKRIPMEEAATIVSQQGKAAFANMQGMNMQPKVIPMSNEKAKNENNTEVTPSSNKVAPAGNTPANIVYKVQLGAFRNQVPVEVMNKYLSIAEKGISNQKNGDLTIYTVGNFKSLQEAESVKADVVAKGITDAFIAVFNNGSKISIEEAKRLEGKQ